MGVLDKFSEEEIKEFKRDFLLLLKMAVEMDKDFGSANVKFYYNKNHFEKYTEMFSKKYRTLIAKPLFDESEKFFRVFIKEINLRTVFANALSKMEGLRSIGDSDFHGAEVSNAKEMQFVLKKPKKRLYALFHYGSVILEKTKDGIEIIYGLDTIKDVGGPEFIIACYYAINGDYDRHIDLHEIADKFTFASGGTGKASMGPSK